MFKKKPKITVVGLGYVGLPLAIALAKHFTVIGFDINTKRIDELKSGFDRTNEVDENHLVHSTLSYTNDTDHIKGSDLFIITVPTPVTANNEPDLTPLEKASHTVGGAIEKGAVVVYESTVYPGVTEEFCGPILETVSHLKAGVDFYLGYSPERINPGDKEHTLASITKVVSGQTPEVAEYLRQIYGTINNNNIFMARSIKTAEAAKVIENAQRDINIAFINEITTIFTKIGLSTYDVLDAASTKWNFLKFMPGLVGGHCIGVDPYYLAHLSKQLNHTPEVILSGRRINESMGFFIADQIHDRLCTLLNDSPKKLLLLGVTFKENVPDLRNSKVPHIVERLKEKGHTLQIHDAMANPHEAEEEFNLQLMPDLSPNDYDCIIGAVPHQVYTQFTTDSFRQLLAEKSLVVDIKNIWRHINLPNGATYWSL